VTRLIKSCINCASEFDRGGHGPLSQSQSWSSVGDAVCSVMSWMMSRLSAAATNRMMSDCDRCYVHAKPLAAAYNRGPGDLSSTPGIKIPWLAVRVPRGRGSTDDFPGIYT